MRKEIKQVEKLTALINIPICSGEVETDVKACGKAFDEQITASSEREYRRLLALTYDLLSQFACNPRVKENLGQLGIFSLYQDENYWYAITKYWIDAATQKDWIDMLHKANDWEKHKRHLYVMGRPKRTADESWQLNFSDLARKSRNPLQYQLIEPQAVDASLFCMMVSLKRA